MNCNFGFADFLEVRKGVEGGGSTDFGSFQVPNVPNQVICEKREVDQDSRLQRHEGFTGPGV
jgi:hypothetical protein